MISKITYRVFGMIFCCLLLCALNAQDAATVYEYDQEDLTEARDGIDYSDDVKELKDEKKKDSESNADLSGLGDALGFLLIGLLVVLVFVILYYMLGNDNLFRPSSKKIKALDLKSIEQIEENLEEHDVAYYLQQAIDNRQFRIAIRLHYLLIIKELSTKKIIKWKRDKTNRSYIYETESYPFANNFKRSTSIFEKVWYGERDVTEGDFSLIHAHFNTLNQEINQVVNE